MWGPRNKSDSVGVSAFYRLEFAVKGGFDDVALLNVEVR